MSLAEDLERAASALPTYEDAIRPANGDPLQLRELLGADGSAVVLDWLLRHEPVGGEELALSWVEDESGAEILARMDAEELPKAGRKALRRALHRMRSRGVAVERPRAEPVVARLPEVEDRIDAGYVSAVDPRGSRLVYLVEPNPSGGARLFEILLDEVRGVVDFEVYSAGRSRIRKFLKDAVNRSRFPAVEAPPAALRALVARIAAMHPKDRALPSSFSEWRSRVAVAGTTPGELVGEALGGPQPGEALALACELVKKGEVGPWGPPSAALAKQVEGRLEELAGSDAGEEAWGPLAEELLRGDAAEIAAQRFAENAYVLWKLEREEEARACLAAADALRSGSPAAETVAVALTAALLGPAVEELRGRAERPGGEAASGEES